MEKLESIETKVSVLERKLKVKREQQDEHGCKEDEYFDEELQQCMPKYPSPKTESEGLTGSPQLATPQLETSQELQALWKREDEEISENTTVT